MAESIAQLVSAKKYKKPRDSWATLAPASSRVEGCPKVKVSYRHLLSGIPSRGILTYLDGSDKHEDAVSHLTGTSPRPDKPNGEAAGGGPIVSSS